MKIINIYYYLSIPLRKAYPGTFMRNCEEGTSIKYNNPLEIASFSYIKCTIRIRKNFCQRLRVGRYCALVVFGLLGVVLRDISPQYSLQFEFIVTKPIQFPSSMNSETHLEKLRLNLRYETIFRFPKDLYNDKLRIFASIKYSTTNFRTDFQSANKEPQPLKRPFSLPRGS